MHAGTRPDGPQGENAKWRCARDLRSGDTRHRKPGNRRPLIDFVFCAAALGVEPAADFR